MLDETGTGVGAGAVQSIAHHWDLLWYLLVVIVGAAAIELRLAFYRMCKKQDKFLEKYTACQLNLPDTYVNKEDYKAENERLNKDREKRWEKYFFPHTHHPTGEVKISHPGE